MPDFMVTVGFEGVVAVKARSKKEAERKASEMDFRDFDNIEAVEAVAQQIPSGFIQWGDR